MALNLASALIREIIIDMTIIRFISQKYKS